MFIGVAAAARSLAWYAGSCACLFSASSLASKWFVQLPVGRAASFQDGAPSLVTYSALPRQSLLLLFVLLLLLLLLLLLEA